MTTRRTAVAAGLATLGMVLALAAVPPVAHAADIAPWQDVAWTAPAAVSPAGDDVHSGGVWEAGDGSLLALWEVRDDPAVPDDGADQVFSSTHPVGGAWTAPVQVSDYTSYGSGFPNFAWDVNADGAAVLTWAQFDVDASQWTVRATTRSAAGVWSPPTAVARRESGGVGVFSDGVRKVAAVGPTGQATVLFVATEATTSPGDGGALNADREVYQVVWSGSGWSTPAEVSVEAPGIPFICNAPDPDDCPDLEGDSGDPRVTYDGLGGQWVAWVHERGPSEAHESTGVFLRGPDGAIHLANSTAALEQDYELAAIDGDPAGGVALAWHRQVEDVAGWEPWAYVGMEANDPKIRVATASPARGVRSIASRDGNAVAVVGVGPLGVDGSQTLTTARRIAGAGAWTPGTAALADGQAVNGTSGRSAMTPQGMPVIAYAHSTSDVGLVLAPNGIDWSASAMTGPNSVDGLGTLIQTFDVTGSDTLLASWLSEDGGVDRLFYAASDGLPADSTPPPPVPVPNVTAPSAYTSKVHPVTTTAAHNVSWSTVSGATYDVRYRRAKWSGSFGTLTQPASWQGLAATSLNQSLSRGYTYCYSVRATTSPERMSSWSAERCTIAPLDQTSAKRSSRWKTKKSSAYFGGSAWVTTSRNATLTRKGVRTKRVGVLATTCRTCGTIDVYVGSKKIGRISLRRSTATANKRVLMLPVFGTRSGTVRIKVVTKGRSVKIDGLIIGAR